jgi:signal transduction histidine kinase/ActR/RegA family two-component response regulator/HAMP domain-containing protein
VRRKLIIGLVGIFAVVLVGGGITSVLMEELSQLDMVHFQMERLASRVNSVHIHILETTKALQEIGTEETRFRRISEHIVEMNGLVKVILTEVNSGDLAAKGCGTCHTNPQDLVVNLKRILDDYVSSFDNFTMLSSLLVTRGERVDAATVQEDLNRTTEEMVARITELDQLIASMLEHSFTEVQKNLARLNRIHDVIIIITTVICLLVIVVMIRAVGRPVRLLSQGTEAIVKGDYAHRIELPGRDEMAVLAERFNYMAEVLSNREKSLTQKKAQMEELNSTLDRKVRERTAALREKQEELNRKFLELESANEELQASYIQLETTAAELQEAQAKLQENYDVLKKMNDELRKANEVKNRFLAVMSHELRTPLTIINGYMSLVLEKDYGRPTPELAEILRTVKEQGKSQLHLIEDLLDLTRIESGEFKLHRQACDPNILLRKVVDNFKPRLEEKQISITLDIEGELPSSHWDYQKMLQVFQNLLDNALKFTPAGGWIALGARARGDFIECRVSDNGIGIPRDKINQVFDRFYQVDSSATRRYGGVGLGLSIVREIILAHNGKIFVESEEGKGTTFLILAPYGVPPRAAEPPVGEEMAPAPERMAPQGRGETVLVADDDPGFLEMMTTVLPAEGYRVVGTAESRRVVALAKERGAQAILLDLMMPDMDGYQVCRDLRADPATADLPIIILSASGGEEVVKRVLAAGADDYLLKPLSNQDVLARLAEFLSARRRRAQEEGGAPAP